MFERLAAALLCRSFSAGAAQAHFRLNTSIRVIHIEHVRGGLKVYLRLPMPMVLAGLLGPAREDGSRVPAPFTRSALINGKLMHFWTTRR